MHRAVNATSDDDWGWQKCTRSFVTEPADHFLMRLQYLDEAQNGIFDVCFPSTNPMGELHAKYADMLNSPILEGPLKALVHHFLLAGTEVYTNIINNGRRLACAIDSQVWFWMDPAADFPNRWAAAVDTRRTTMEQNVIWKEGWEQSICCQDPFFCRKLRDTYESLQQLQTCKCFRSGAKKLGKTGKLCNMSDD